jgi:hypothetical protein
VPHVEVRATSELPVRREQVWARIVTIEGINDELRPWMRMTAPRGMSLDPAAIPLGRRWFRSWILLFGLIPFDYDDLCVERIDQPSGFLERSRMLSASVWEHERTLDELPGGRTRLSDRVSFIPRVAHGAPVHRRVIAATFAHRHRRLRRFFAAARASG